MHDSKNMSENEPFAEAPKAGPASREEGLSTPMSSSCEGMAGFGKKLSVCAKTRLFLAPNLSDSVGTIFERSKLKPPCSSVSESMKLMKKQLLAILGSQPTA